MIIVRLMGGLGNQMFQYALGRRLAYERQTTLKLDLTWFQTQTLRHYMLDCLKINAEVAAPQDIARLTKSNWTGISGMVYQAIQWRLPYYQRIIVEENKFGFDTRIFRVRNNVYLTGYWQSEKYFNSVESILRREFILKNSLSPKSVEMVNQMQMSNSISLHVRRQDYVNDAHTNQVHGVCSLEYYQSTIAFFCEKVKDARFFVFSDDLDWAIQNLSFQDSVEFITKDQSTQDEEEMILMSHCRHHVIANSSYSWWGAWLGKNPGKIVIAPQRWFTDTERDTSDLIPETWIRM